MDLYKENLDINQIGNMSTTDLKLDEYYRITPYGSDFNHHESTHMQIKRVIEQCEEEIGRSVNNSELASWIAFICKEGDCCSNNLAKICKNNLDNFNHLVYFISNEYIKHQQEYIKSIAEKICADNEADVYKKSVAIILSDVEDIMERLSFEIEIEDACKEIYKLLINNLPTETISQLVYHICLSDVCVLEGNYTDVRKDRFLQHYQNLIEKSIDEFNETGKIDCTCESAVLLMNDWPVETHELIKNFRGLDKQHENWICMGSVGSDIADSIKEDDLSIIDKIEEELEYKVGRKVLLEIRALVAKNHC